jgi:hypothetical protein
MRHYLYLKSRTWTLHCVSSLERALILSRNAVNSVFVLLDTSVINGILDETNQDSDSISAILSWLKSKPSPSNADGKRLVILTTTHLEKEIRSKLGLIRAKKNLYKKYSIWPGSLTVEARFIPESWLEAKKNSDLIRDISRSCRKELREIGDDAKFVSVLTTVLSESRTVVDRGFVVGVDDNPLERAIQCLVNTSFHDTRLEMCAFSNTWAVILD